MSLRTNYTGALDTKLAEARTSGRDNVLVTNLALLTTAMTNAANQGKKSFTYSLTTSYQTADLRLLGPLWLAYQSGVQEALASQDIMNNEVTVTLNKSDDLATFVDLAFTF